MKDCCEVRADIPQRQRRVLQIVLIGLLIAGLFATSAVDVIRWARRELASPSVS